jgi:predicted DNA-binding protein (UPF0251 family)
MATKAELVAEATDLGIDTTGMKKADLEAAIAAATRTTGVRAKADALDATEVVRLKDEEGLAFRSIAEQLGVSLAVVMTVYVRATEGDLPATAKAVAKARAEGHGWRVITARTGLSKEAVKALAAEAE